MAREMAKLQIAQRLIERGMAALNAPRRRNPFTRVEDANEILNNIEECPHIFVLGCIADRRMPSGASWSAAYKWCRQVVPGGLLTFRNIQNGIQRPGPRIKVNSRYPITTDHFYATVSKIHDCYGGHAERIWQGNPIAAAVVRRFLEFDGVGPKIANMAAHILLRDFKVRLREKQTIDMPVDGNVIRVFERLGLISEGSPESKQKELIIYTAKELCPGYPAVFDTSVWRIGNEWCHGGKRRPRCQDCNMNDLCPKIGLL